MKKATIIALNIINLLIALSAFAQSPTRTATAASTRTLSATQTSSPTKTSTPLPPTTPTISVQPTPTATAIPWFIGTSLQMSCGQEVMYGKELTLTTNATRDGGGVEKPFSMQKCCTACVGDLGTNARVRINEIAEPAPFVCNAACSEANAHCFLAIESYKIEGDAEIYCRGYTTFSGVTASDESYTYTSENLAKEISWCRCDATFKSSRTHLKCSTVSCDLEKRTQRPSQPIERSDVEAMKKYLER